MPGRMLDRDELDKLIAQDAGDADVSSTAHAGGDARRDREPAHDSERNRGYDDHCTEYRAHKRKRSIFDMFDFD